MLNVKIEMPENFDTLTALGKASAYRAIERTVDGIVTDVSREIRAKFNVSKQEVDKRMKKVKPTDYDNLTGWVEVKAKDEQRSNLPLILFGAKTQYGTGQGSVLAATKSGAAFSPLKQAKRSTKNNGRVSFKVLTSGGKGYRVGAQIIRGGGSSWQVVVFNPLAKGRKRIRELRVISVPDMLRGRQGVMGRVKSQAEERLRKTFDEAAKFYVDNPGKIPGRAKK